MEKPIVFLSHSSKDKGDLARLKELLNKRSAGSIDFFLSSDGQSIRLGTNWVVGISDALDRAKLMFLFLTTDSANSKWIHFEAGHANAKNIQVIPICLPGMDLVRMTPPLSLLQGFNLHSYQALSNLARICNEVFGLELEEKFTEADFRTVFAEREKEMHGSLGEFVETVQRISVTLKKTLGERETLDPASVLSGVAAERKFGIRYLRSLPGSESQGFETIGCTGRINKGQGPRRGELVSPIVYEVACEISPRAFDINAKLLDEWRSFAFPDCCWEVTIQFVDSIVCERRRAHLTGKLLGTPLDLKPDGNLSFKEIAFALKEYHFSRPHGDQAVATIELASVSSLSEIPLAEIFAEIFEANILMLSHEDLIG